MPELIPGVDAISILTKYLPCLKNAGKQYVSRYLRNLTADEVAAICGAGLKIVSCAEKGHPDHREYFTKEQGITDGQWAVRKAQSLGQPVGSAIFFTVDYGCPPSDHPDVIEYFRGVNQGVAESDYKVGGYAPGNVLKKLLALNLIKYVWLPNARSWQQGFTAWNIKQGAQTKLCGVQIDPDEAQGDFGAWALESSSNAVPSATTLKRGMSGESVKALQSALVNLGLLKSADGIFGPATENAVKTFQGKNELTPDGVVGPKTRQALKI